jgi:hypothetical protein
MRTVEVTQGTEEWFRARLGIPTASRFADIMAVIKNGEAAARRNYRSQLVIERLTGRRTETFVSQAMKDGTEREPFARIEIEARIGKLIAQPGFVLHDVLQAGASPDGMIDADLGVEIKCPIPATHFEYMSLPPGACPPEYRWQVQGSMWITGAKTWLFASFNPEFPEGSRLIMRWVKRNEADCTALGDGVENFIKELDVAEAFVRNYKEPVNA